MLMQEHQGGGPGQAPVFRVCGAARQAVSARADAPTAVSRDQGSLRVGHLFATFQHSFRTIVGIEAKLGYASSIRWPELATGELVEAFLLFVYLWGLGSVQRFSVSRPLSGVLGSMVFHWFYNVVRFKTTFGDLETHGFPLVL